MDSWNWSILPYRIIQEPFNLIVEAAAGVGSAFRWAFGSKEEPVNEDVNADYWVHALAGGADMKNHEHSLESVTIPASVRVVVPGK